MTRHFIKKFDNYELLEFEDKLFGNEISIVKSKMYLLGISPHGLFRWETLFDRNEFDSDLRNRIKIKGVDVI